MGLARGNTATCAFFHAQLCLFRTMDHNNTTYKLCGNIKSLSGWIIKILFLVHIQGTGTSLPPIIPQSHPQYSSKWQINYCHKITDNNDIVGLRWWYLVNRMTHATCNLGLKSHVICHFTPATCHVRCAILVWKRLRTKLAWYIAFGTYALCAMTALDLGFLFCFVFQRATCPIGQFRQILTELVHPKLLLAKLI